MSISTTVQNLVSRKRAARGQCPKVWGNFPESLQAEFIKGSAIALELYAAAVNVVADIEDESTPIHDALGWKFTRFGRTANAALEAGLLLNEDGSVWQAKLSIPRADKGKTIKALKAKLKLPEWDISPRWLELTANHPDCKAIRKYESPKGNGALPYLPPVPPEIRRLIGAKLHLEVPETGSFWEWVAAHPELPIIFTEGAKKSMALLSRGYIAIALYGVNSGYIRDSKKQAIVRECLSPYVTEDRPITLAFDQDEAPKTRSRVNGALRAFGAALLRQGAVVKVAQWQPEQGKGADDVIVNDGFIVDAALDQAVAYGEWCSQWLTQLSYEPQQLLNQRYIGDLTIPDGVKLVGIKAPKGTGKTTSLEPIVHEAMRDGRPVLLLGHRVQLVKAICQKIGLPYVSEIRDSEYGAILGYGLCMDSLRAGGQAGFSPEGWDNALVIIDEAEQVLWHLLTAKTEISKHRPEVIQSLRELLGRVASSDDGQVILMDADLSDVSVNAVRSWMDGTEPYIIRNDWKPAEPWHITSYSKALDLDASLVEHLQRNDGPVLVLTCGQREKSKYGTVRLESRLKEQFPQLRILRADSTTISDPTHPACGCAENINQIAGNWDVVIMSPSLETGVSIDIKNHFTAVYGFFQGNLPAATVRQFLARLRDPIPRHVFIAPTGMNNARIAGGHTSPGAILRAQGRHAEVIKKQLISGGLSFADDSNTDATALDAYARMAARINFGFIRYREGIETELRNEGHTVEADNIPSTLDLDAHKEFIEDESEAGFQAWCDAVEAVDTEGVTLDDLRKKKAKTATEQLQETHLSLEQRYSIDTDAELVAADSDGLYGPLRLLYYTTVGREHLSQRDKAKAESILRDGQFFAPDFTRANLGTRVKMLDILGITQLLESPGFEILSRKDEIIFNDGEMSPVLSQAKGADGELMPIVKAAIANRKFIKTVLGIKITPDMTAMEILRGLLGCAGVKIASLRKRPTVAGQRWRLYKIRKPEPLQNRVLNAWLERDTQAQREDQPFCIMSTPRNIRVITEQGGHQKQGGHQTSEMETCPNSLATEGGQRAEIEAPPPVETPPPDLQAIQRQVLGGLAYWREKRGIATA
ncbi:MAG: plasmid replication protein, CyRepA1 family [Cyanobacteria bacterium P01_F01_bin.53]